MSLNFCILASGSSGNCSVIWDEKTAVLIDCGCSSKYVVENLNKLGLLPKNLTAAFITHAHTDHLSASGLGLLWKNNIPIYLHEDSYEDIYKKYGSKIEECVSIPFYKNVEIQNILVESFDAYHKDANVSHTFGFTFSSTLNARKYKIGYLTDTGKICSAIIKKLINSNILVIESNYNRMMLDLSFRPYDNKKWTASSWGHLSNEDAADAICAIKQLSTSKDSLKYVFLAHISQHHNTHDIAMKTAKEILLSKGINDIKLLTAKRKQKSPTIRIS
ncbi:MBL fold metallo-hydrolase [Endomicrobiia bacterium]|nr:MBL fold metallo-hydrolase [Endomicrobiia bacterium]